MPSIERSAVADRISAEHTLYSKTGYIMGQSIFVVLIKKPDLFDMVLACLQVLIRSKLHLVTKLQLDFDVHAGRKIKAHQGINCFWAGIVDVNQALVRPHLEMLE